MEGRAFLDDPAPDAQARVSAWIDRYRGTELAQVMEACAQSVFAADRIAAACARGIGSQLVARDELAHLAFTVEDDGRLRFGPGVEDEARVRRCVAEAVAAAEGLGIARAREGAAELLGRYYGGPRSALFESPLTSYANLFEQHCAAWRPRVHPLPSAPTVGVFMQRLWNYEPGLVRLIETMVPFVARRKRAEADLKTVARIRKSAARCLLALDAGAEAPRRARRIVEAVRRYASRRVDREAKSSRWFCSDVVDGLVLSHIRALNAQLRGPHSKRWATKIERLVDHLDLERARAERQLVLR